MSDKIEREAFEAWARGLKISVALDQYGAYVASYADDMWDGWEARAALASTEAAGEPIYQLKLATGDWRDQNEIAYRYNAQHPSNEVRIVYTAPPPAKLSTVSVHNPVHKLTDGDAKGLEIIASWLDRDGLVEPAAMLRRIASSATASDPEAQS